MSTGESARSAQARHDRSPRLELQRAVRAAPSGMSRAATTSASPSIRCTIQPGRTPAAAAPPSAIDRGDDELLVDQPDVEARLAAQVGAIARRVRRTPGSRRNARARGGRACRPARRAARPASRRDRLRTQLLAGRDSTARRRTPDRSGDRGRWSTRRRRSRPRRAPARAQSSMPKRPAATIAADRPRATSLDQRLDRRGELERGRLRRCRTRRVLSVIFCSTPIIFCTIVVACGSVAELLVVAFDARDGDLPHR